MFRNARFIKKFGIRSYHFIYGLGDVYLGSIEWSFTGHFWVWSGLRIFFSDPASNIWDGLRIWTLIDRLRFRDLARNFGYFGHRRDNFNHRATVWIGVSIFWRCRLNKRRFRTLFCRLNRRLRATILVRRALTPTPLLLKFQIKNYDDSRNI